MPRARARGRGDRAAARAARARTRRADGRAVRGAPPRSRRRSALRRRRRGLRGRGPGRARPCSRTAPRVEADLVVVGIGAAPETAWLESSGLRARRRRGLRRVLRRRSAGRLRRRRRRALAQPAVRREHARRALEQRGGAGRLRRPSASPAATSAPQPFAPVPFFWSDQYDVKIQFAGRMRGDDEVRVVAGSLDERKFTALYGRGGRAHGRALRSAARATSRSTGA